MNKFFIELSPFTISVTSDISLVKTNLETLYPDSIFLDENKNHLIDYHVSSNFSSLIRKFIKPQSVFAHDGFEPFMGLPLNHAYASLEWGINYVVATNALEYVNIHSGVVAHNDDAILFPAPPGSGKSTLTAYLQGQTNWRLLSDEMTLIFTHTHTAVPFTRPICLKNKSCELVKSWYPDAGFSTIARNTHKGDVIHVSPSELSWQKRNDPATIKAIVFPQFKAGQATEIYQLNNTQAFMMLAENAFNFNILGETGFNTLTSIIETVPAFEIQYSDVEDIRQFLEQDVLNVK